MEMAIDPPANAVSFGFPRPFLLPHFRVTCPLRQIGAFDRALFAHRPGLKQAAHVLRKALRVEEFTEPVASRYTFLPDLPIAGGVRTLYLGGYWQAAALVDAVADTVRPQLQLRHPARGRNLEILEKIRASRSAVSLHVRRGDYMVPAGGIQPLSMDYYSNAISLVRAQLPDPSFFVFSDDIEFARKNLPDRLNAVFVNHNDDFTSHEDLRLMAACSHHIIANSSFSWWGAWLNPNPTKLVTAPRDWLGRPGTYYPELFPKNWTIVG
jgi:hypothetical protein